MKITDLVEQYGIEREAVARLSTLAKLLAEDPAAPTAVREPGRVVEEHLADALVALELPIVRDAGEVADLGAGAGVPGLPLAIAMPQTAVTLVEANGRKCEFLRRAVLACELTNVVVENVRAESWLPGRDHHDLVTARALAPLPVVAEYAAPLLRIGGSLVVWRGARDSHAEAAAARAATELGLEIGPVTAVQPYPRAHHRHLHVLTKRRPTSGRFPRRPGVARKRPLGTGR